MLLLKMLNNSHIGIRQNNLLPAIVCKNIAQSPFQSILPSKKNSFPKKELRTENCQSAKPTAPKKVKFQ